VRLEGLDKLIQFNKFIGSEPATFRPPPRYGVPFLAKHCPMKTYGEVDVFLTSALTGLSLCDSRAFCVSVNPLYELPNAWTSFYEALYVYHGTWAQLSCIFAEPCNHCSNDAHSPVVYSTFAFCSFLFNDNCMKLPYQNCGTTAIKIMHSCSWRVLYAGGRKVQFCTLLQAPLTLYGDSRKLNSCEQIAGTCHFRLQKEYFCAQ
jgi:hypothetical protein